MKSLVIAVGTIVLLALLCWLLDTRPGGVGVSETLDPDAASTDGSDPAATHRQIAPPLRAGPGRLTLRFLHADEPVAGVEVQILGDGATWSGISDQDGQISRELADGEYRWRLVSAHAFELLPLDREAAFQQQRTDTSDAFRVAPGETVRWVMHQSDGIVRGAVVDFQGQPISTTLTLLSERVRLRADGRDYDARWLAERRASVCGSFEFTDLCANATFSAGGESRTTGKVLWLRARRGRDIYTARRAFSIQTGQVVDLGTIVLHHDRSLAIDVAFEDRSGVANQPFVSTPDVWIQLLRSTTVPMPEEVIEELSAGPGTTLVHGLSHGTYDIELDEPHAGWPELKPGYKLLQDGQLEEAILIPGQVKLTVIAESGAVPVQVWIAPIDHDEPQILVFAMSSDGRLETTRAQNLRSPDGRVAIGAGFSLIPGEYVFAASNNDPRGRPDETARSLFTEQSHRVDGPTVVTLALGRGSAVSGTLSHPLGRPVAGRPIKFTDSYGRVFKATCDDLGQFNANGLPPGGSVTAFGRSVPCGASGVRLWVAWSGGSHSK